MFLDNVEFGKQLKNYREDRKLNQIEFGKIISYSQAELSKIENGKIKRERRLAILLRYVLRRKIGWIDVALAQVHDYRLLISDIFKPVAVLL